MAKLRQLDPNGITWHAFSGYPRLENLATNPSFEATSGTVDIWKNLAINPSFESVTPGSTILRTNIVSSQTWFKAATNDLTITPNISWGGSTWTRITQGATGSKGQGRLTVDLANLMNGATYTVSVAVANSGTTAVSVSTDWCDSGTATYSIAAGETRRISATGSRATYDNTFRFMDIYLADYSASILVKDAMVEQTDQVRPYFDGSTPDALGWDYGWTGTPGSSTSTAKASYVEVVRNLVTNPSFETSPGTIEIRRNNATNPHGVGTSTGYGQQTLTPNVAISGHPDGLTTATRVSYVNGNTTPGVVFNPGTSVNTQYTVSAWIYQEINASNFFGFAQQGVLGGPNVTAPVGTWARVSWTFTSHITNTAAIGFRLNGTAVSDGSFLIAGMLLEKTDTMKPFFGGNTSPGSSDFTYSWVGTANASESVQQAPGLGTYVANGGNTIVYQGKSGAETGTKVARLDLRAANATGVILSSVSRVPALGGKTYTALGSGKQDVGSLSGREFQTFIFFYDSAGALLTFTGSARIAASNSYVSPRVTAVAPANTNSASIAVNVYGGQANDLFTFDSYLLAETAYNGPYFDGSTPSSGDVVNLWTGATNSSASIQVAPTVVSAPSRVGSVNYQSQSTVSGTRSIAVRSLGINSDTAVAVGGEAGSVFTTGLSAGKTYTVSATITTPVAQTGVLSARARKILFFYQKPDLSYVESSSVAGPTTGTARVSVTLSIPADAVGSIVRLYNGSGTYGDTVYWDDITIVEGTYTGPYFDGNTLTQSDFTYAWLGTANASESVQRATKITGVSAIKSETSIFHVYKHIDTDGSSVVRYLSPKSSGAATYRIAAVSSGDFTRVKQGRTYTLYIKYRGSAALSAYTFGLGLMDSNALNKVLPPVSGIPITTGWSTWSHTFVAEIDGRSTTILYPSINTLNPVEDYTFDIAEWMLVEGHAPPAKYFDGSLPEDLGYIYSWTGAPNASTSLALPK